MRRIKRKVKYLIPKLIKRKRVRSTLPVDIYGQRVSDLIHLSIESDSPFMVSRLGGIELDAVIRFQKPQPYGSLPDDEFFSKTLCNNAGFFSPSDENLRRFSQRLFQ